MAKTTVPIELSSTPSIVDNGNATAITIDSSQNVGIGGTPFYSLDVQGSATDYEGLRVLNTNTAASPTTSAILLGVANSVRNVYTKIQTIEGGSDANETRLAFFTNDASNNLTEALRIDENQNAKFQGGIRLEDGVGTGAAWITKAKTILGGSDNDLVLYTESGLSQRFYTQGSERMRITSSGLVLIGTTSAAISAGLEVRKNTGNIAYFYRDDGTGVYLAAGNTSWSTASDERLKTTITPFQDSLTKICSLQAGTGRYLTDSEDVSRSFLIAQDVQAVLPEAVDIADDEIGTMSLRYMDLIPLLVSSIKELKEKNDALEARITALEGN